jgi:hypothetical protein
MTSSLGVWLPDGSIFLEKDSVPPVRPHRPWNQGDIFADVTITLTNRSKTGDPVAKTKPGYVMLIGHPCSLRGGGTKAILQNVAQVRPAKDKEKEAFVPPWDSHLMLFPLVDFEEGLWVTDFNVVGTVHFKLLEDKRVACLTLEGWAALQRRYASHSLRIDQSIEDRAADIKRHWDEINIWEEWCSRGYAEPEFEHWITQPIETDCPYRGTPRRQAIELAADIILAELPTTADKITAAG